MNLIVSVTTGAVASLVDSLIWFLALRIVRPRVDISQEIAEEVSPEGTVSYRIKVVNRTRRAVVDLRLELSVITPTRAKGGPVYRGQRLVIENEPLLIPGPRQIQ